MATTAALLQIQVAAETTKAALALKKLDRQLVGIDKTTATATTRTSNLGKASSKAGSMLKTAAISAGSAALAYLSISQAKSAVTVTQDLAKTTAGLSRNLGLSSKQASRWGTVAKARDIDAKALTMSFTTLSRRITDMSKGSESAVDSFKDIGVTQKEMKQTGGDFNKQLLLVADAFGEAEGGATRQQAAQKLLGRGYQTLLPMFAEGSKSLKEQQAWADKYGTTLSEKAVKSQMDLVNAQRESKVAMLGLQVSFTEAVTPALKEANKQFQRIAQIMGSDKLTNAEKFEKVGKIVGEWATKAKDAFVKILPELIEAAGKAAPDIAGALVKGFVGANVWGKLLVGGWLLSKMGGLGAFSRAGTKAGGGFWGSFFGGGAAGTKGKIAGFMKGALKMGGVFAAITAAAGALQDPGSMGLRGRLINVAAAFGLSGDAAEEQGAKFTELQTKIEDAGTNLGDLEQVVKHINLAQAMDDITAPMGDKLRELVNDSRRQGERLQNALGANLDLDEIEHGWSRHMRNMAGISQKELDRIGDLLRDKPRKGVDAFVAAMDRMVDSIRQAMKDGEISTRKGNKKIHSILIDQLGAYGISHGGAQKIIAAKDRPHGQGGSLQRGGPIDQGRPSGDSVPAMLERGEYVLNRNAVASVGKRSLDALNFSAAKRFAKGGAVGGLDFALGPETVPPIQYDPDHAGGNSHWHVTGTSTPWIVGIGKALQKMGFMVGEHPAFGGVTAQHSATGGHYDALAIDVNSAADETHAETVKVAALLGGAGGLPGGFGQVKIKLPRFKALAAMFTPGAAGLNNSAAALEKIMGRRAAQSTPAGVAPTGGGALSKAQLTKLWNQTGKGGDANLMAAIALAESGGNPSVTNSIGARGLWQIIPSTAAAFGLNYGNLTDPVANAKGAHAILAGQGLGAWEAYTNGAYSQYLRRGGMVGMAAGGGVPGAPPGFEMGRFGSAHKRLAQLPGMKKRVAKLTKQIAKTDERIQIQQTLAGLPTSPGGAELAGSEKTRQLGLYDRLLEQLMSQRKTARQGFRTSKHFKKNPAFFRDVLVELEGLTGGAGRLLDTKVAMAELKATPPAGTGGISIDDLLRIREGATLGLLGGLGNGLAAGGAAPAPSAGPEVNINYANGMEWLRDFVSVQVDGRDRRTNIRSLAGVRR